jgi:DNA invertase Pin-like site-specific DNA recombinase
MSDQKTAVIYARVASISTRCPADACEAQVDLCREAAEAGGYKVIGVFADHASGNSASRPGLDSMLAFIEKQSERKPTVFVENPQRLARSAEMAYRLLKTIEAHGGTVRSVNMERARNSPQENIERERD